MKYFETIRCENGFAKNLYYHKKRIADTIGLDLPLEEYIYPPSKELLKCKLIYDKNGVLEINYSKYQKRIIKSLKLIKSNIKYDKKYLNRDELNQLFEQKQDCDDILIVDSKDNLKDTSIANIALFINDTWLTPKNPLLYGTTRARLIEKKRIFEEELKLNDLKKAKGFALLNSMIDFDIIEKLKIKGF